MEELDAGDLATNIIEVWFDEAEGDGFDYTRVEDQNVDRDEHIIYSPGGQKFRMVVELVKE